jgi:hypothetical protein
MKWNEIKEIALNVAFDKEEDAGYAGERGDGGGGLIRSRVDNFENKLIEKLDLRPSEKSLCYQEEIGLPYEFSLEIKIWKGLEFYNLNKNKFKAYF